MGGFGPTTSFFMIAAFSARPVASSYSSSDMTSMASGSSRNFARLGMRRIWVPSFVSLKLVLLIGPYWAVKSVVCPVEVAPGFRAVLLRPALVLRLEHAARVESRRPIREAIRLPVMVPSDFSSVPP